MIPSMIVGVLPKRDAIRQEVAKAKADVAAWGLESEGVTLDYQGDVTINGVSASALAQKVQANL